MNKFHQVEKCLVMDRDWICGRRIGLTRSVVSHGKTSIQRVKCVMTSSGLNQSVQLICEMVDEMIVVEGMRLRFSKDKN